VVLSWFRRRRQAPDAPRLTPRSEQRASARVELAELTPSLESYLGHAAYLQLTFFEMLARSLTVAPTIAGKEVLSRVASRTLEKHHGLVDELRGLDLDVEATMEPHAGDLDRFRQLVRGQDWYEALISCYVAVGFLDDFFVQLGSGLGGDAGRRAVQLLAADSGADELAELVRAGTSDNERLAWRLAMWGRRLIGDTMLVARGAVDLHDMTRRSAEERIEPVFTELIAAHTRRMDGLGLTP
jgi:hypothetical protein